MADNNSSVAGTSVLPVTTLVQPDAIERLAQDRFLETILGSYDGYLAATYKIPPYNPDRFLVAKGYGILDDMMTMGMINSPVSIIRNAVLYKGVTVQCAVTDQSEANYDDAADIANAFEYALDHIEDEAGNCQDISEVIEELTYAVHTGFRVTEINYRIIDDGSPYAGKIGFCNFAAKPCRQIGFDMDPHSMRVRNITSYTPGEGYDFKIPVEKVLRYTFRSRDSLPYGNGIGRVAYKHYWSVDFAYKIWNIALELFGTPFLKGTAPANAVALVRKVFDQVRGGAPLVVPEGCDVEVAELMGGGLTAFQPHVEHHAQAAAVAYLNSVLTSGTGTGGTKTNALGNVHVDTQEYGLARVRSGLEHVGFYQLARRWVRYNYGPQALALTPRISLGTWDEADAAKMAKAFSTLIDKGVMHEREPVIRERIGLPPPDPEFREALEERSGRKDAPPVAPVPDGKDETENDDPPTDPDAGDEDKEKDG